MLDKLTVLISDHNDGCTFVSTSFASRCKHSNAVVGVFIQTRQSSSSSWSRHELSFLRHTTQHPVGNSVTQNNAILISRWNMVPLNDNTSRASVKCVNIIRRGIWLCNKRERVYIVSTEGRREKWTWLKGQQWLCRQMNTHLSFFLFDRLVCSLL